MVIALLRLFAVSAFAGSAPLPAAPTQLCADPLKISESTVDCAGNTGFSRAAEACSAKLDEIEAELGLDAKIIDASEDLSQNAETATSQDENAYALSRLHYLQLVATEGERELAEYPAYVFLPPDTEEVKKSKDGDPYPAAAKASCYQAAQEAIAESRRFFAQKLASYQEQEIESEKFAKALHKNDTEFRSLSKAASAATASGAPGPRAPARTPANNDSTITGVKPEQKLP